MTHLKAIEGKYHLIKIYTHHILSLLLLNIQTWPDKELKTSGGLKHD